MAVQTVAEAAMVVRPDFSRTGPEVEAGAHRAGRKAGAAAERGFMAKLSKMFQSGGKSAADNFAKGFGDNGGAFSRVIATMAAKTTIAAAALAAATPGVAQLTAALIPATGAAVALPAALLAAKAAAITFKVATAGTGEAIKKGFTGSAEEAKKALEELPPSARRFARSVIDLKPRLDALRKSVAGRFFGPLQNEVRPLADRFLPSLQKRMGNLGGALGNLGEQIAQSARKTSVFKAVNGVFDSATTSAGRLRAGIDPLMQGLAAGLRATTPLLPGLATGLARVATNAGNWLKEAGESGRIVQIYRNAVTTIRTLGQIFGNVGAIIATVWKASDASGGNLLKRIAELTGEVRRFVQSGQGMSGLATIFGTLSSLGGSLRTGLGAALPAIGKSLMIVAPLLARLAQEGAELVVALAPLLPHVTLLAVQLLTALLPAIVSVTGWLQRNQDTVRSLAPVVLGAVVAIYAYRAALLVAAVATRAWAIAVGVAKVAQVGWTAISWLASAPVHAHTAAMRLSMSTIGTWVGVKAIEARAWLASTGATVRDTAAKVANRIATVAHAVATRASTAALGVGVWAQLTAGVIANRVAMTASAVATKVHTVATAAWAAVTAATTSVLKAVRVAVLAVNAAMKANPVGAVIAIITILVGILVVLYQRNQTVRRVVDAVWKGIKTAIAATANWFMQYAWPLIKRAIDFLIGYYKFLWSAIKLVWSGIRLFIATQANLVIGVFNKLKTFIMVTLPNAFRTGVSAIQKFWAGLQEAARKPVAFVVNSVINPFLGGFQKIAGVFGVKTPDPIRGFEEGGQIPGAPSSKDNRIAWLKNSAGKVISNIQVATGEFVVNARDTAKALPLLRWINAGMRGGPSEVVRRIGRRPVDRMGDGSDGGYAFAKGGLVGFFKDVWGSISDPKKLVAKPFEAALSKIPGGGMIRDLLVGMGKKLIGGFVNWVGGAGGGAGGNVGKAQAFVKAQNGKPYVWAAAGPGGYDCSGIVSAAYNVLKGRNPYSHTFSTGQLPGPWFNKGQRVGPLVAGWAHPGQRGASANVGHMAGMIGGLPFESSGSRGVRVGGNARRVTDFASIGVARAGGGLVELQKVSKVAKADFGAVTLAPGNNVVYNGLGRPEHLEEVRPTGSGGVPPRLHPDDIAALADAIGGVIAGALLSTVPMTTAAARRAGRRPGR